ncbi:MAG: diguanylate cyclase [Ruminococcus sp.]|nr:diguanylate cyclase [Ruminococcus sp.]
MDKKDRSALYELAGKCFARYLGYVSLEEFMDRSTSFTAALSDDTIRDLRLSQSISAITSESSIESYSALIGVLREVWSPEPLGPDIGEIFSREKLISMYRSGSKFISADYACVICGETHRKQIACQLSEEDGQICGTFLIFDLTDEYSRKMTVMKMAEYDGLTQLLNKQSCENHVEEFLSAAPEQECILMIMDIDFFKRFNDQYGHDVGDIVLQAAARTLEKFFGRDSIIGRTGGDEFLVLLKHRTPDEAEEEIGQFCRQRHFVERGSKAYTFTFSVGYAVSPSQGSTLAELSSKADMALYNVKMHHRNDFIRYSPEMLMQKRTQLSFNLSDIVSGIPGAILVYKADEKEEILFANEQLYALFECDSMDELLRFSGDSFRTIVHPDDLDRVEESILRQVNANEFGLDYVTYRIITKTGRIKVVDDIGHLVHTPRYGDIFYVFLYDREQKNEILRKAGVEE